MSSPFTPAHNILLTIPRTASHLLTQLLNLPAQPGLARHPRDGYFFLDAIKYRFVHDTLSRPAGAWADDEQKEIRDVLQRCCAAWEDWLDGAEKMNKGTYVKEHVNWMVDVDVESAYLHDQAIGVEIENDGSIPRNPTCIPETLFNRVRPTFLIRHPALTFPSLLRTALDNEGRETVVKESSARVMRWEATFRWHRMLYEYLTSTHNHPRASHIPDVKYPIIVDAADLANPQFVRKYAAAVGLDVVVLRFEWQRLGEEERRGMSAMEARMKDTLAESEGVVREKLGGGERLDVEKEREKWIDEFGDMLGKWLVGLVGEAMGDYWWLWERRMRM